MQAPPDATAETAAHAEPNGAHPLVLYNTMARRKQPFAPRADQGNRVSLYCCGVTVYDYSHIGVSAWFNTLADPIDTRAAQLCPRHSGGRGTGGKLLSLLACSFSAAAAGFAPTRLHCDAAAHSCQHTMAWASRQCWGCGTLATPCGLYLAPLLKPDASLCRARCAGHARVYCCFDVLVRVLRHLGYSVTYVRNFTDVDDKIIARARQAGEDPLALAQRSGPCACPSTRLSAAPCMSSHGMKLVHWVGCARSLVRHLLCWGRFIGEFHADMAALNCQPPDLEPRATEHVGAMVAAIERILANNHAYVAGGDVFFAVDSLEGYGRLSGRSLVTLIRSAAVLPCHDAHAGSQVCKSPVACPDQALVIQRGRISIPPE